MRQQFGPGYLLVPFTICLIAASCPDNYQTLPTALLHFLKLHKLFKDVVIQPKFRKSALCLYSLSPHTYKSTFVTLWSDCMGRSENINFATWLGGSASRFMFSSCAKEKRVEPRVLILDDCSAEQWKVIDTQLRHHFDGNRVNLEAKFGQPITKTLPPMVITTNKHPKDHTENIVTRLQVADMTNPYNLHINLLQIKRQFFGDKIYMIVALLATKMSQFYANLDTALNLDTDRVCSPEAFSTLVSHCQLALYSALEGAHSTEAEFRSSGCRFDLSADVWRLY